MKYFAYARGKNDTELKEQITVITEFCEKNNIELFKEKVYSEKDRGKASGSPVFNLVMELMEDGDALIVASISVIGVSKSQLLEELRALEKQNNRVISLDIPTTADCFHNKTISELANMVMVETLDCILKADKRKKDTYQQENAELRATTGIGLTGRPRTLSKEEFNAAYERVLRGEIRPSEIIEELKIPKGTYYRYKSEYDKEHLLG